MEINKNISEELYEMIINRRSVRKFTEERISDEEIKKIVDAGLSAPSARNRQEIEIVVIRNDETIAKALKAVGSAMGNEGYNGYYNSNNIIIIASPKEYETSDADAACVAQNMMLMASALNIGSVWVNQMVSFKDNENILEFSKEIGLKENYRVYATLALGKSETEIHRKRDNKMSVKYID